MFALASAFYPSLTHGNQTKYQIQNQFEGLFALSAELLVTK